jgi:hypothetical protein
MAPWPVAVSVAAIRSGWGPSQPGREIDARIEREIAALSERTPRWGYLRVSSGDCLQRRWLHASAFCLQLDPALRRVPRESVHVAPEILGNYVGRYQIAPSVILTVTQQNGDLYAQLRNAPEVPIYPESETEFFCKPFDAQITFVTDGTGRATGLVFQHDGRDTTAQRLD